MWCSTVALSVKIGGMKEHWRGRLLEGGISSHLQKHLVHCCTLLIAFRPAPAIHSGFARGASPTPRPAMAPASPPCTAGQAVQRYRRCCWCGTARATCLAATPPTAGGWRLATLGAERRLCSSCRSGFGVQGLGADGGGLQLQVEDSGAGCRGRGKCWCQSCRSGSGGQGWGKRAGVAAA